ncbi:hypothetical protein GCM10020254_85640 [Streptomyces goshikiensis]
MPAERHDNRLTGMPRSISERTGKQRKPLEGLAEAPFGNTAEFLSAHLSHKGMVIMENEKNLVMEILEDDNFDFEAEFGPRQDVGH